MNESALNRTCPKCGNAIPADAPQGLCPHCVLAEAATVHDPRGSGPGPAAAGDVPSLERVRAAFPQLEVFELVGRGGMGFVFKARQPHLDRLVALKLLPDKLARDPQFAERFNREGRVLARLNHPNIVSVFDFGRTEHFYFLTMEFVGGVNLRQAMQAGRFTPAEALGIVPKICEALQYAHEQGVLHRDIKPENILLDARGRVKIADFGIAKLVEDDPTSVTLTGTGAALGTPHYMAPEQLEKPSEVDHRADIYSLGVVFYEMLTGELPIGRFAPPSAKTPVNTHVDEVVFRTLEKDREKRFQSAGEVKTQVEHLTQGGAAASPGAASGVGGEPIRKAGDRSGSGKASFAFRAFAGAALVGISLAKPLSIVVSLLTGRGGVSPRDLWLAIGSVLLPGLGGTLVGWLALNEIRDSRGAVRGLPFALFATLAWPLLALLGVTLVPPMLLLAPGGGSDWAHTLGRMLVLLLPAGVLTFALWAVYATARWAMSEPAPRQRGILKWVFTGLLVVLYGIAFVSRTADRHRERPQPTVHLERAQAALPGTEPLRAHFEVPRRHIAVFELYRFDDRNQPQRVPGMSGFVIAPAEAPAQGELVLEPVEPVVAEDDSELRWAMKIRSEDGGEVSVGTAEFGPLHFFSDASHPLQIGLPPPPFMSLEIALTGSTPDESPDAPRRHPTALGLTVQFVAKPVAETAPETPILGGSTNWETGFGLAAMLDAQQKQGASNAPAQIRLSVTDVKVRGDADGNWLVMDYVANVDTNWATVFRAEASGFETMARTIRVLEGRAGARAVRHERAEVRLPADFVGPEAVQWRDELARALVAEPVEVPTGREIHLFKLPVGNAGLLTATMGARPARETPSVRLSFNAVQLEPRGSARVLAFEYAREDHGADFTIQSSGRFPGETVNLTGATYAEGGSPGHPPVERHRLEFGLPRTLARPDADALHQRLAAKWLGHPLVVQPGDQHTLFAVPAGDGTEVKVTVVGRLPDASK